MMFRIVGSKRLLFANSSYLAPVVPIQIFINFIPYKITENPYEQPSSDNLPDKSDLNSIILFNFDYFYLKNE